MNHKAKMLRKLYTSFISDNGLSLVREIHNVAWDDNVTLNHVEIKSFITNKIMSSSLKFIYYTYCIIITFKLSSI